MSQDALSSAASVVGIAVAGAAATGATAQVQGAREEALNAGATGSANRELRNTIRSAQTDLHNHPASTPAKKEAEEALEKSKETLADQTQRVNANTDPNNKGKAALRYAGDVVTGVISGQTVKQEEEVLAKEVEKAANRVVQDSSGSRV